MRSLLDPRAAWLSLLLASAAVPAIVALPSIARAQSAADKSTARDLAIEGIEAYGEGKHAEALDKLERAQALYDAHVHLVYIARCQVALGRLVEAAESYRALARKPLPPDASEAVRKAQEEGAAELAALEPRIPRLRIDVAPAGAKDLRLSINGQAVSAAIVGVERPTNPGEAVVRVGATGYRTGEAKVTLAEGARQTVTITLEEGAGGPPVVEGEAPGVVVAPAEGSEAGPVAAGGEVTPPAQRPVSFVLEPRLAAIAPFGQVGDSPMGQVVRGGGGLEVRFGVHFLRRLTGLVMVAGYGLAPDSGFESSFAFEGFDDPSTDGFDEADAIESGRTGNVGLADGGVGFMVSSPHRQYGWFAEVDLLAEAMVGSTEITIRDIYRDAQENPEGLEFSDCRVDTALGGGALRLSGGGIIPVAKFLQLAPFASASLGHYGGVTLSGDCEQRRSITNDTMHGWLGIGVGGQFLIAE